MPRSLLPWPWASTSQSGGNTSSGFAWARARLRRAICWVFTIHHLPCHHLPSADAAGQPYKHKRGRRYPCGAAGLQPGLGPAGGMCPHPGPGCHRCLAVLGQRAASGFAPWARAAAGASPRHPRRQHVPGKIAVSCPEVLGVLLRLSRPACQRPPARLQPPLAGGSARSIPAPRSRAEKAIKESQTPRAKQNTVYGA